MILYDAASDRIFALIDNIERPHRAGMVECKYCPYGVAGVLAQPQSNCKSLVFHRRCCVCRFKCSSICTDLQISLQEK